MSPNSNENSSTSQKSVTEIWNPVNYDTANGMSYYDAIDIIKEIQKEESSQKLDVIFEIGCGSGNITNLLYNNIAPKKIVACDISEEMIDFASKTYSKNKDIEYLVQDFGVHWEELDPRIRELEGSVNMVFSSYAMHLISHKKNAISNIRRLLTEGGRCCVNIPAILFFNEADSAKKFLEREEFVNWITKEAQFELFKDLFTETDLSIEHSETTVRTWVFPSFEEFEKLFVPVSQAYANHVMDPNTPEDIKSTLVARYEELFLNFIREYRDIETDETCKEKNIESVKVYTDRFRFMCRKE